MAGTASTDFANWLDGLNETIAVQVDMAMAPIERLHNLQRIAFGQDAIIFPSLPNALRFANVTQGTIYNTQTQFQISGVTITPIPGEFQIDVTEHALRNNPQNYMEVVAGEATRAIQARLMSQLVTAYDDLQQYTVGSGAAMLVAHIISGGKDLAASGFTQGVRAVLHPTNYWDVMLNAGSSTYNATALGSNALEFGTVPVIAGIELYQDSNIDTSTGYYRNFMGTKDCIGIAIGWDSGLKILNSTDATHIRLGWSFWSNAAVVAAKRGRWFRD